MPRPPDRSNAKVVVQANVSRIAYEHACELLAVPMQPSFRSFSQMTETLLFLAQHACYEQAGDAFARRLLQCKASALLDISDLTVRMTYRRLSLTLDVQARDFLVNFTARYPGLCSTKGEALELLYTHAGFIRRQREAYLAQRLCDVMLLHP